MDVTDVVRGALKVVEDAGVPRELRAAALPAVIELVARQVPGSTSLALVPFEPQASQPIAGAHLLEKLAGRLSVPTEVVEGVYTTDGSSVDISVHPGRLPRSRSAATKALALLITAYRQTGDEEFTPVDEIRRVAQEYDRYDGPNFASAIGEMRGSFLVKGSARQRSLKLTRPGWTQAADLIRELGEGSVR